MIGEVPVRKSAGIHSWNMDLFMSARECLDTFDRVLSIETGIEPPFSCLRVTSDRATTLKNT